jgi:hypothetical protein
MAALASASHGSWSNPGKSLLAMLADAARRAQDYSRLQGLSRRYLDDAGLTPAELDAALGVADLEATLPFAHSV